MSSVSLASALDLRIHLNQIYDAYLGEPAPARTGEEPRIAESRDLLRLFVQIGQDELRAAIVRLLRAIVEAERDTHI